MIVLASASPRRMELLKTIFPEFKVSASGAEEDKVTADPQKRVMINALLKAEKAELSENDILISADTVVSIDGKILEKPKDTADARRMLRLLSGKTHTVYTGVAMKKNGETGTFCEATRVTFRELSDELIESYIRTGEPMDKAGAYGIQGPGAFLASGISGDYYNVMGLPVCRLRLELEKLGWIE